MAESNIKDSQPKTIQIEQELQLKKRARRRLVGAIALVLVMLVILPMVLDDRAAKPEAPITISIPDEDNTQFSSKIVPLPPVDSAPVAAAPVPEVNGPVVKILPEATSSIDNTESVPIKKESITDKPLSAKSQSPTSETIEAKLATSKIESHKTDHFVVQIGVFSNAGSVKDLQVKLLADGVKTHTDTIKTDKGDKIRLRTESFDSRDAANKALESVKSAGITGMIVAE